MRPLGLRLARADSQAKPQFGAEVLFETLRRFGFAPKHVMDVGANHGNWTRSCLKYFPDARYTLLEPQDRLKVHIEDLIAAGKKIEWVNAGAADQSGQLPFLVAHRDDSSTFAAGDAAGANTVIVEVVTLDDLLVRRNLSTPDLLKVDAEGFDLKVLAGAKSLLGKTEVVLVEASVLCPYENTVAAAIAFLSERGYRLIDVTEINRSPKDNVLWLVELAFLRSDSRLFEKATSYE